MAIIEIPSEDRVIRDVAEIRQYLNGRGVWFDQWEASVEFGKDADQETILNAYAHVLKPYMERNGYSVADVLNITPDIPNLDAARQKFLKEHTHTEDEVRFFVEGKGYFWFNLQDDGPVFAVLCEAGDLISVPANTPHWFDMGAKPNVKAIRVFIDMSGWVPHYTESGTDVAFNKPYETVI